jgi:hypothetical protein
VNEAIARATEVYGVDVSQVNQGGEQPLTGLRPERADIAGIGRRADSVAEALPDGRIILPNAGRSFFYAADGTLREPGFIGAALAHESQHIEQLRAGRYGKIEHGGVDVGTAINELEAYDHMLAQADRFGLSGKDRRELQEARDRYAAIVAEHAPEALERIDGGDYGPGTEVEPPPEFKQWGRGFR